MSFLDKDRTIAGPGFSRWLVPPAALAIHLCIGMAYGFSVFWLPLSKAIGISSSVACSAELSFMAQMFSSDCDWKISMLGWMYNPVLRLPRLGRGAVRRLAGTRRSAQGGRGGRHLLVRRHGHLGHRHQDPPDLADVARLRRDRRIGLGLGYISPVSTLIKWFPDRRGMATGMAIMGFGGGAMIGAPLADKLMKYFATPTSVGVYETFLTMAVIYFIFMMGGALSYRVPASGWKPAGWTPPVKQTANAMITGRHVHVSKVWGIPQFWLVWLVLCLNVTAGIGILGMSSPLIQEVFGGQLLGLPAGTTSVR